MKSNRRSVLIGLGALTVGGGAVFGTGAFSSVEAERQVEVNTEGDAAATVAFTNLDDDYVTENDDGAIEIDISGVNVDATFTIEEAFTIENNHSESITLDGPWEVNNDEIEFTLSPDDTEVSDGGSTTVDVTIETDGANDEASIDEAITITANT